MTEARNFFRKISDKFLPDRQDLRKFFREVTFATNQIGKDSDWSLKVKEREESYYRDKLARKLGGKTEIKTPDGGRIDILTSSEIIEVKHVKYWRSALGQIISYGYSYPRYQKRIHLFGDKSCIDFRAVEDICRAQGVKVSWEVDE